MNFLIPTEIFVKLTGILYRWPINVQEIEKKYLNSIFLEHKDGLTFAVATNRKIAGVYFLGNTKEADGFVNITVDKPLVEQAKTEIPFHSNLNIVAISDLNVVSIKTDFGYNYPGNGGFFAKDSPQINWRTWLPKTIAKQSKGAMGWLLTDIEALTRSSPSGDVAFPEFIDANEPVIMRDNHDDNWMGMFMSNHRDETTGKVSTITPASIPTWVKI